MFEVDFEPGAGTEGGWWAYARRDDRPTEYQSGWYFGSGPSVWDAICAALRGAGHSGAAS